jgi:hypothetical protein
VTEVTHLSENQDFWRSLEFDDEYFNVDLSSAVRKPKFFAFSVFHRHFQLSTMLAVLQMLPIFTKHI